MLALLMLMAMVPPRGRPQEVHAGPPAPHLDRDPAVQWRLSSRAAWSGFVDRWPGRWQVRWDPRNGTPRFLGVPGITEQRADELARDIARLAGVDPSELGPARLTGSGRRSFLVYERTWRDIPVDGDQVVLVLQDGRIGAAWVRLTPIHGLPSPRPGEVVFSLPERGLGVLATRSSDGPYAWWEARDGTVLYAWDTRSFETVSVSHQERTVGDDMVEHAARKVTVSDPYGVSEETDDDGRHGLSGDLVVDLEGSELNVTRAGAPLSVSLEDDGTEEWVITGGTDVPQSAATVLHHFHVVWDWLEERWPGHAWLSEQVLADVEVPYGACNAYYSSGTINFYPAGGSCNDLGEIADVVYHEVGHGIHEYILAAGTFASEVSEGSSDYIAATILGDPVLAPNAWVDGGYIREIGSDRVYPDDLIGESHNDGLIWASFLWNLRGTWMAEHGDEDGLRMTDLLLLGALEQGPTLTDAYEAVLVADDDDGDLSDGTPHDCELLALLDAHGLGPGPIGAFMLEHVPLGAQDSDTVGYELSFDLYEVASACGDLDLDSVAVWYSVVPEADLPDLDAGKTAGWEEVALGVSGDTWTGTIPRQPATSHVFYFITAASGDGSQRVSTYGADRDGLYDFWVGDRHEIWCEDFETGAADWTHGTGMPGATSPNPAWVDQWQVGTPSGDAPDGAFDGEYIAATALDEHYAASNVQHLLSPEVDLSDTGPMLMLSYQRWLEVEDALYDQASLWLDQELLWRNQLTEGGSTQHIDPGWFEHDLELTGLFDPAVPVRFAWTLASDQGLEFGGWALDEVCVVDLLDVPGHYRVSDLSAMEGEQLSLAWTNPWMTPLSSVALVRRAEGFPQSVHDGVILLLDQDPAPGEEVRVVDTDANPGEEWYYAVFSAGEDDSEWYSEVVEGENAVLAGLAAVDTGAPPEVDDEDPTPTEINVELVEVVVDGGCGCAAGPGPRGLGGLLVLLSAVSGRVRMMRRTGRPPGALDSWRRLEAPRRQRKQLPG